MAFSAMTQDQVAVFMAKFTDAQVALMKARDAAINMADDTTYDTAITAVGTATTAMTVVVDASIGG